MCSKSPNARLAFPEKTVLVRERIFAFGGFGAAWLLSSSADLVVRCGLGRQHLRREIEWHARFRFRLVLGETFFH